MPRESLSCPLNENGVVASTAALPWEARPSVRGTRGERVRLRPCG